MTDRVDLDELERLAKEATPGPWRATKGCGAQVGAGVCIKDTPGSVTIKRGGFFLLEIDPDSYDQRDDDDDLDEEELQDKAHADTALIAAMRNSIVALIAELRSHRAKAGGWIRCEESGDRPADGALCAVQFSDGSFGPAIASSEFAGGFFMRRKYKSASGKPMRTDTALPGEVVAFFVVPSPPEAT